MMLANLRTKTETTSEIIWEKSCNWVSTRPKAGSARSSDSGANPIDEITGESSSGTNSSAPEYSIVCYCILLYAIAFYCFRLYSIVFYCIILCSVV